MDENEEFEFRLRAEREGVGQPKTEPIKLGQEGFADSLRQVLRGTDWGTRNIAGAGSAVASAWEGLKGLVPGVGSDQQNVANQKVIAEEAPIGNIAGNVAMLAPTAFIPGANTVTGAAAINAITGGLLTPGDLAERGMAAGLGALGGGGGVAAGKGIGALYRAGKATAEPLTETGQNRIIGRLMRQSIEQGGGDAQEVAARMAAAQSLVPGSMPTAAEVAESGGIAALQRAMAAANPEAYSHRFIKNADAREAALREIAGMPGDRAAAEEAREGAAKALYKRAFDSDKMRQDMAAQELERLALARTGGIQVVNPTRGAAATGENVTREVVNDPAMLNYLGLPSQQTDRIGMPVAAELQTVARQSAKGPGFSPVVVPDMPTPGLKELASRPVFADAMADAQSAMANRGMNGVPVNSLQGLHLIKLSIDETLNGAAPASALAKYDRGTLLAIKKQLLSEMESIAPLYGNARQTFAEMSKPLNQMDVGQYLLDKLEPAAKEYGKLTGEKAGAFFKAVKDSDKTVKLALKNKAPRGLADVLTPEQMQSVTNVARDLARVGNANDLGRGVGSNTFQNLAMDNLAAQSGVPSAVSLMANVIPGASAATNVAKTLGGLVYRGKDETMKRRLAEVLLDPKQAAKMLVDAQKQGLISRKIAERVGNDPIRLADLFDKIGATRGILGASLATQGRE